MFDIPDHYGLDNLSCRTERMHSSLLYISGYKCLGEFDFDLSVFPNIDQDKLLLICFGNFNFDDAPLRLADRIKDHLVNSLILSSDPFHHLAKSNLVHYPFYYYFLKDALQNHTRMNRMGVDDTARRYKVCCLNGVPRHHRIYNYLILKNKPYFDDCLFSMHTNPIDAKNNRNEDIILPIELLTEWNEVSTSLPQFGELAKHGGEYLDLSHVAYRTSYINLITETTVASNFFISEKTWKPIAAGQLFLLFGCTGAIDHLRGYGIDTFDDIINHDYYDTEIDPIKRMFKLHEVLDDLIKENLHEIFVKTYDRRKQNMHLFYDTNLGKRYTNDIQQLIQNIKNV